jgi:hypothetical protein
MDFSGALSVRTGAADCAKAGLPAANVASAAAMSAMRIMGKLPSIRIGRAAGRFGSIR